MSTQTVSGSCPWQPKPMTNEVCRFEQFVTERGIPEQCWPFHPGVIAFVQRYKNNYYVPESLLTALHVRVQAEKF